MAKHKKKPPKQHTELKKKKTAVANVTTPVQPPKQNKFKTFFKSIVGVLTIIGVIAGIIVIPLIPSQYDETFKSEKEKWEDVTFFKGLLIPFTLSNDDYITIRMGTSSIRYHVEEIKAGVDFKPSFFSCGRKRGGGKTTPFDLKLKIINDRLFISAPFVDIQKQELVGRIEYNRWKLVKSNLIDHIPTDSTLEVIDRGENVIFGMEYNYPNTLSIKGYFVGECIIVIGEGIRVLPLEEKQDAISEIKKISRFIKADTTIQ